MVRSKLWVLAIAAVGVFLFIACNAAIPGDRELLELAERVNGIQRIAMTEHGSATRRTEISLPYVYSSDAYGTSVSNGKWECSLYLSDAAVDFAPSTKTLLMEQGWLDDATTKHVISAKDTKFLGRPTRVLEALSFPRAGDKPFMLWEHVKYILSRKGRTFTYFIDKASNYPVRIEARLNGVLTDQYWVTDLDVNPSLNPSDFALEKRFKPQELVEVRRAIHVSPMTPTEVASFPILR